MVARVITGTGVTGTHRRDYGSDHKKKYYGGENALLCVGFIVADNDSWNHAASSSLSSF